MARTKNEKRQGATKERTAYRAFVRRMRKKYVEGAQADSVVVKVINEVEKFLMGRVARFEKKAGGL